MYDAHERLCKRIEPETGATLYAYDAAGNLDWYAEGQPHTTLTCDRDKVAAAAKILHSYDARNRLLSKTPATGEGQVVNTYTLDGLCVEQG